MNDIPSTSNETVLRISKLSESTIRIVSEDEGVIMELDEYFAFYVEGYRHMPLFKNKMWDGKTRNYNRRTGTLAFGLLSRVNSFASTRGYKIEYESNFFPSDLYPVKERTGEFVREYISGLPLTTRGEKIEARDYQIDAVTHGISSTRAITISPTGSGKSLIIYLMIRWFLEHGRLSEREKALIIVPSTALVEQLQKDFIDYSSTDPTFNGAEKVHKIYSGKEKMNFSADVVITTWQSAHTIKSRSWFEQYGMIIGDEAHGFAAKSLIALMNLLTRARYRIGTTGTLPGSECTETTLTGCFGPPRKVISTKELMDADMLAQLKINLINLKYDSIDCAAAKGMEYDDEIKYIVFNPARMKFIQKLALSLKGNTLVMFNLIEKHGIPMFERMRAAAPDRKIYFVSGGVDVDDREKIRSVVEKETNSIILGSGGVFSQGVNIRNLHNIIFAAPNKSQIRVLQSIGRGLRKADNGQDTVLYDIVDDLRVRPNSKPNFALSHAMHRVGIYEKEKFSMKIFEYKLTASPGTLE